jgi:hypothetical protein
MTAHAKRPLTAEDRARDHADKREAARVTQLVDQGIPYKRALKRARKEQALADRRGRTLPIPPPPTPRGETGQYTEEQARRARKALLQMTALSAVLGGRL